MKKKNFIYGLVLGAITLFASCGDEDALSNSTESDNNGLLNNEAIVQEAISFASSLDENTTRSSSAISAKGVQKVNLDFTGDTRADNATDFPDFYSVGLNDGKGTVVLVEKDNAIRPIAYFQNENDVNINDVLVDSTSTFSFIVKALLGENLDFKASDVAPTTRAVTNTIVERLEPKCKVYWHQGAPYNKYCFTKDGQQAKAGCVAIAGAQALTVLRPLLPSFVKPYSIFSWDDVTSRSTLSPGTEEAEDVAFLVYTIGYNVGMNYGVESSGARVSNLASFFKKTWNIEDYDCERAIDVLKTKNGVIVIETNYNGGLLNLPNLEEISKFKGTFSDDNKSYRADCRLWKPFIQSLRIICKFSERLNTNYIKFDEDNLLFNEFTILFLKEENIYIKLIDSNYSLLYNDQQIININNNDNYNISF